ncbi:MAG: isochorismate synthase [Arthrobacter sp.]|jgi:isochorismate synthase|nr:isochorismate synthase [Arthrobacter sp.]
MSATAAAHVTVAHPFRFASGRWLLQAEGGRLLSPVFGPDPAAASAELLAQLRAAEARTGRTHVLCGLIPFDTSQPAHLRLTSRAGFLPRTRTAASGAGAPLVQRPPATPRDDGYTAAVSDALRRLARGEADKVVLSRTARHALPAGADLAGLAEVICDRLAELNPAADVYCAPDAEGQLWLGASPEIIADVRQGRLLTHPLAGSIARTVSREDAVTLLSASEKDRREHHFVVSHIEEALRGLTASLRVPAAPEVFATDAMWHLGTRITGSVSPETSALDAALAIHPTPAVCGTPTASASRIISELEPQARGFYAGLVGWMDASGDGRFSLVLRGARMDAGGLELRAGAGIVEGSDPEAEHRETEAKFRTMLAGLEGIV